MTKKNNGNYSFTILGCGSSGGVPRLSDGWGSCDPKNLKNYRLRCSLLIKYNTEFGETKFLIDTSPDLRQQLLTAQINDLDGIIFTHAHADHMHGIDDLRMIFFKKRSMLPIWADLKTSTRIRQSFTYLVEQEKGTKYPPILSMNEIKDSFLIQGPGGEVLIEPLTVKHGDIDALGFRIGNVAYIPDVSEFYEASWERVKNLDILIIDALRRTPHPNHAHLAKTLKWIKKLTPRTVYLTNMHNDLDYEMVNEETPKHVFPAFDGLTIHS
ncbi:MAG: MBL fold metallo-hydrolase [Paracoccaceae bacterium]|nr:MBL fold metallo-hydrolase [Paracoccaceae bacterium]